jgi:hypothetical protein
MSLVIYISWIRDKMIQGKMALLALTAHHKPKYSTERIAPVPAQINSLPTKG